MNQSAFGFKCILREFPKKKRNIHTFVPFLNASTFTCPGTALFPDKKSLGQLFLEHRHC